MAWLLSLRLLSLHLLATSASWTFTAFDGQHAWTLTDGGSHMGRVTPTGLSVAVTTPSTIENPLGSLGLSTFRDQNASEKAVHEADVLATQGDLRAAYKLYLSAGKTYTGQFGALAAMTALELHERLGTRLTKKTLEKLEHRVELAITRVDGKQNETSYRIARLLMVRGKALQALPLLQRDEPVREPLTTDVRRQGLLDQALQEIIVSSFASGDNEGLAKFYAGYGKLITGHGNERWLQTLLAQAFYELDMPHDTVRILALSPEETPIIARELLAAQAAYDVDMKLRASEHLRQLRPFVTDNRIALLTRMLGESK